MRMEPATGLRSTAGPFQPSETCAADVRRLLRGTPGLPLTIPLIPSVVHGFFDYALGLGAILAPDAFGFAHHPVARRVMQTAGALALLYSLFTNYELGVVRIIRFPTHLLFDVLSGTALLLTSRSVPSRRARTVFTVLGAAEVAIALLTHRHSRIEESECVC
jgi:hypothetical protein